MTIKEDLTKINNEVSNAVTKFNADKEEKATKEADIKSRLQTALNKCNEAVGEVSDILDELNSLYSEDRASCEDNRESNSN